MSRLLTGALCWLTWALPTAAQPLDLTTLRSGHPRLHFTPDKLTAVKALLVNDTRAIAGYANLQRRGNDILNGVDEYPGPITFRVVTDYNKYSRYVVNRMQTLAGLYLLDGESKWLNQARTDLLTITGPSYPYWKNGPNAASDADDFQMLETSAFLTAASLGYDWLYSQLTAGERTTVRSAIVNKGLQAGLAEFQANASWVRGKYNWGLICNAGMGVGALAVADEEAVLAGDVLTRVRDNLREVMELYAPDGGCDEAITYWSYGIEYLVYFLEAAQTGLNNDLGLHLAPGFSNTGYFPVHMTGPTLKNFNFSDQVENTTPSVEKLLWLARKFRNPIYAQQALSNGRALSDVYLMLYYDPSLLTPPAGLPPKDARYRYVEVATMRTSWGDANASFAGLKAGYNSASHGQLDNGTFVLDALGERWAVELGSDSYGLFRYFSSATQSATRWKYYRCRTEGQNTLAISANTQQPLAFSNQHFQGRGTITNFASSPADNFAVADLTDAYRPIAGDDRQVSKVQRGIQLLGNEQTLIQDEVVATSPVEVIWNFHTRAVVSIQGTVATLTQNGKVMRVEILSPAGASFLLVTTDPGVNASAQESRNNGRNLTVRLAEKTTGATIAIRILPANSSALAPVIKPLSTWGIVVPATPTNLTATPVSSSGIQLNWTDNASNETAYLVERSNPADGVFSEVVSLPAGTTAYTSAGLTANTSYQYQVRAGNGTVYSQYSNLAGATTLSATTGTGLRASYFNTPDVLGTPVLTRVDPVVDFNWDQDSPLPGTVGADRFSVRWEGQVEAPLSGSYTFSTVSDDGVRLWVNDTLVIDNWSDHPPVTDVGPALTLAAGEKYPIRLEYYENGLGAIARLQWAYGSQGPQVVPQQRLYPLVNAPFSAPLRESADLSVYPNPLGDADQLTIVLRDAKDWSRVVISDLRGRVVYRGEVSSSLHWVSGRQLASGLYVVSVSRGQRVLRAMLVVK